MTIASACRSLPSARHAVPGVIRCVLVIIAVAAALPAVAAPVTYTFTAAGVNGNVGNSGTTGSLSDAVTGGSSFTGATLTMALAGDTADVTGSNGDTALLGSFASIAGDRISFTLTGGGLSSPVSGTMLASDGWTFLAGTAPQGQGNYLFFVEAGSQFLYTSFMRPGPNSSPVPTYDSMVNSQSFSVTSRTVPGSNSAQDPPGTFVGGTNFGNWDTVTVGVYRMVGTTVGGLYVTNGSNDYFNGAFNVSVVPEPAAVALLAVAALGFSAAHFRRRTAVGKKSPA